VCYGFSNKEREKEKGEINIDYLSLREKQIREEKRKDDGRLLLKQR